MDPRRTATRLLTAGMDEIIFTLRDNKLSLDELRRIENALRDARRKAEQAESGRQSKATPADLVAESAGDWGCYEHDDTPRAVAALNKLGEKLVEAIRSEKYSAIRKAVQAIRDEQRLWSRTGADDTEGREAIWAVVQAACAGTDLDADTVWDASY